MQPVKKEEHISGFLFCIKSAFNNKRRPGNEVSFIINCLESLLSVLSQLHRQEQELLDGQLAVADPLQQNPAASD